MSEHKPRIGLAMCGSYCTYAQVFEAFEALRERYELFGVLSENAAETDSRFGTAVEHLRRLREITGRPVRTTIAEAEPLGPAEPLDALVIAPCTGNTLAKLARGVTDSAVLMAAKAHLRNDRPLLLAFSTNDALSASAENIGRLLVRRSVYFVPFRQDDPEKKPHSVQADFTLLGPALEAALEGRQLQPLLLGPRG